MICHVGIQPACRWLSESASYCWGKNWQMLLELDDWRINVITEVCRNCSVTLTGGCCKPGFPLAKYSTCSKGADFAMLQDISQAKSTVKHSSLLIQLTGLLLRHRWCGVVSHIGSAARSRWWKSSSWFKGPLSPTTTLNPKRLNPTPAWTL